MGYLKLHLLQISLKIFALTSLQVKLVGFVSPSPAPPSSRNAMVNEHAEKRSVFTIMAFNSSALCGGAKPTPSTIGLILK